MHYRASTNSNHMIHIKVKRVHLHRLAYNTDHSSLLVKLRTKLIAKSFGLLYPSTSFIPVAYSNIVPISPLGVPTNTHVPVWVLQQLVALHAHQRLRTATCSLANAASIRARYECAMHHAPPAQPHPCGRTARPARCRHFYSPVHLPSASTRSAAFNFGRVGSALFRAARARALTCYPHPWSRCTRTDKREPPSAYR